MPRSTILMLLSFGIGLPIVLIEHPTATMGATLAAVDFGAAVLIFIAGCAFWALDRE